MKIETHITNEELLKNITVQIHNLEYAGIDNGYSGLTKFEQENLRIAAQGKIAELKLLAMKIAIELNE